MEESNIGLTQLQIPQSEVQHSSISRIFSKYNGSDAKCGHDKNDKKIIHRKCLSKIEQIYRGMPIIIEEEASPKREDETPSKIFFQSLSNLKPVTFASFPTEHDQFTF